MMIIESAVALGLYLYGKREITKRAAPSSAPSAPGWTPPGGTDPRDALLAASGGSGLVTLPDGSLVYIGAEAIPPITPPVPSTLAQQQGPGTSSAPAAPSPSIAQPASPKFTPAMATASPGGSGYIAAPVRYSGI